MGKEKNFENKVKNYLKNQGCWFVKYWGGGEFTKAGIPDILCCCNGYFIGIEIKSEHGKPSQLQLYNLKKIEEAGGYAVLLYPKDYEKFMWFIVNLREGYMDTVFQYYEELKGVWSDG